MLAAVIIYLIITWGSIPDQIPAHYNAAGEIDRIGGKGEVLALPIIASVLYLILTMIGRFPKIWNTGVKLTEENRERVLRILKNMLDTVKLLIVSVFLSMTVISSLSMELNAGLIIAFLALMFGSIFYSIAKLIAAK